MTFGKTWLFFLLIKNNKIEGVRTKSGFNIFGKSVILTNGTFLNGKIYIGEKQFSGGRLGDNASFGLSDQIIELGFEHGRMKTGTPVRIDGRTINTELMQEQKGDDLPGKFSFSSYTKNLTKQRSCYITYTSPDVHDILKTGFNKSPLFNKTIEGIGPRYCPLN